MKIKLEGVVTEMRRVYDTVHDSHNNRGTVTHGWMAKVSFRRGALNSDPIEIPVQESDGITIRSIIEIEMTAREASNAVPVPTCADCGYPENEHPWTSHVFTLTETDPK